MGTPALALSALLISMTVADRVLAHAAQRSKVPPAPSRELHRLCAATPFPEDRVSDYPKCAARARP